MDSVMEVTMAEIVINGPDYIFSAPIEDRDAKVIITEFLNGGVTENPYLVISGVNPAGLTDQDQMSDLKKAYLKGEIHKIGAIKIYRDTMKQGLKDCKDAVEAWGTPKKEYYYGPVIADPPANGFYLEPIKRDYRHGDITQHTAIERVAKGMNLHREAARLIINTWEW